MAPINTVVLLLFLWSKVELTLTNEVCSQLPVVDFAFVSMEFLKADYQKGDVILFSCGSGFSSTSNISYVCSEDGWRAKSDGRCVEVGSWVRDVSAQLLDLKTQVEELKTVSRDQAAELKSLKSWTSEAEKVRSGRVAFSASILNKGTVGPFTNHSRLLYKNVFTNYGNAYDPDTGRFTAPVRGVYHFEFHVATGGGSAGAVVALVKNIVNVMATATARDSGDGLSTTGNEVSLLLEAGDQVQVNLTKNNRVYENESHHCTFSGRLLFPA